MDTWVWILIVILALVLGAAIAYFVINQQRSSRLKKRFGPEYDRAVESADDKQEAESHLRDVAQRREKLDIVPLPESSRREYASRWEAIQRQFVEEPRSAVAAADDLIVSAMAERGYPVEQFDERADLVAADHPEVVSDYREAHAIRLKGADATTEDLRQAFVHYRALFDEMLSDHAEDGSRREDHTRGR